MGTIVQDLRFAVRQLLKSPGFALTAIFSLTCGIAATTAVFSVVWALLMNPYPYAAPDRMVHLNLYTANPDDQQNFGTTASQWQELRHAPPVEDAIVLDNRNLTVTGQDLPEDVAVCYMSSNGFEFFGVPAALGRGLLSSDAVDGQDPQPVAVLSYQFWQKHYGGDAGIVGKTIALVRKPYTVIGVAAPRFTWEDADIYLPLKITADTARGLHLEARLKPGVTHKMAEQQLQSYLNQYQKDTPKLYPAHPGLLKVEGLNDTFLRQIGGTLALLFGAVALLLAIGCGNVSILLLARGKARQHEFAVRAAIGASRGRIIRQLLTESLLLSLTGAVLGTLAAYRLLAVILSLMPENALPHEAAIAINLPVLLFSVLIALGTGVLFGLAPALRLSRPDVREAMQAGTRKVAGSKSGLVTSHALIGSQIALTLLMMAAAGGAIQQFLKLVHAPLGYNPHNVVSIVIPIHDNTHTTIEDRAAYFETLRAKIAETPGVTAAAISANATPPHNGFDMNMEILGRPAANDQKVQVNIVSEGYFPLLQIPLSRGRLWSETETRNGASVAVINETLARQYFSDGDPIGHSIRFPELVGRPPEVVVRPGSTQWLQIVGVIRDKADAGVGHKVLPEMFMPFSLGEGPETQILVKGSVSPMTLLHAIGLQVRAIDADQQIAGRTRDLEHWISMQEEYARGQLLAWLFGAFALLALLLAAVGLYSVVSYTVAQRTNEFGIRMALGARREDVLGIVFRSIAVSVGCGVAAGIVLSLLLRRLMMHYAQESSKDPWALVVAIGVLAAVAVVAAGVPARRASRIEPMEALRYE